MITTLTLSLIWIVYSIIPQYLLIHYAYVGRGTTLRLACTVGFYLSTVAGGGQLESSIRDTPA